MSRDSRNLRRGHRRAPKFDERNPQALAICDGCAFMVNRNTLRMQMDYRGGDSPVPTGNLHCPTCYDQPQPYYKRQLLLPDPVPVMNPRPDDNNGRYTWSTMRLSPWEFWYDQWDGGPF